MTEVSNQKSKFLVCVNEKEHSKTVLRFACSRAKKTGNIVQMIYVIDPLDYHSIFTLGDMFKKNRQTEAQFLLDNMTALAQEWAEITPVGVIREGKVFDEIISCIEEDHNIALLLLAVNPRGSKGKLLPKLTNAIGSKYSIPLMLVPGNLTDQQIQELS